MSDDGYDKAYDAGRSGQGFPGGDSIAYAGYLAGAKARESAGPYAETGGGSGGGGAVDLKGNVVIAALGSALSLFGRVLRFLLPTIVGFAAGAIVGVVASDRMNAPREPTMLRFGAAGAAILLVLWLLRRLIARRRSGKRRPFPAR